MTPQQQHDARLRAALTALRDCMGILQEAPQVDEVMQAWMRLGECADALETRMTPEQEPVEVYDPQPEGRF